MEKKDYKSVSINILIAYAISCILIVFNGIYQVVREGGGVKDILIFIGFVGLLITVIILAKLRHYVLAKYLVIVVPAYFFLLASIYMKSNGFLDTQLQYLAPRVLSIFVLMAPIIFFGLRHKKKMAISYLLIIPPVLFFDTIHNYFGIYLLDLPFGFENYTLFKSMLFLIYCIPLASLLLFQQTGLIFRKQLLTKNEEIIKANKNLEESNLKLQFQAHLYTILNITSKNLPLEDIMQGVLNELLEIDTLNIEDKGLIFLTNKEGNLKVSAHKNCEILTQTCGLVKPGQCLCGIVLKTKENLFCDSVGHDHTIQPTGMKPHGHYVIPIKLQEEVLGVINIYIKQGAKKDEAIEKYLEAIAGVLARKIISENQKTRLKDKTALIKQQQDVLKATHKELTDSVNYAKLLQESLLPNQETLNRCFNDTSVLFLPKDGISGDFYFAYEISDYVYFGVGDCTGHGIPGAFLGAMSVEAVKMVLNENIGEKPNFVLDKLRDIAKQRFDTNLNNIRTDSMDAGFCMYNKSKDKFYFSGGFTNLMVVRDGEINEIVADKCPIGSYPIERPFTLHEVDIQKNDVIYLATDGYIDQFGMDPNSKKDKPTKFKRKRFKEEILKIHNLPCAEQVEKLEDRIKEWSGNLDQIDDITVFIARH